MWRDARAAPRGGPAPSRARSGGAMLREVSRGAPRSRGCLLPGQAGGRSCGDWRRRVRGPGGEAGSGAPPPDARAPARRSPRGPAGRLNEGSRPLRSSGGASRPPRGPRPRARARHVEASGRRPGLPRVPGTWRPPGAPTWPGCEGRGGLRRRVTAEQTSQAVLATFSALSREERKPEQKPER